MIGVPNVTLIEPLRSSPWLFLQHSHSFRSNWRFPNGNLLEPLLMLLKYL